MTASNAASDSTCLPGRVASESTAVPSGGFCTVWFASMKNRAMHFFLTTTTDSLELGTRRTTETNR